ncbi:type II secretion system F family protein [Gordonia soli]|uniref:Uncharacterized protein n=1 Tax=Gordonia soli NBRC 108243 TaxID=1223545 RepID=M0QJJ5_9ACTN|nr:type II secretion system F family protein [Gordonia soli]GAC67607.1 hypothetical protein GS4_08_01920 [Gordonia soli NBRC 108243]
MIALLMAAALACLLWPRTRAQHRLDDLSGRTTRVVDVPAGPLLAVGVPTVVVVLAGPAAGIAATITTAAVVSRLRRRRRDRDEARAADDLATALGVMIAELSVGAPPARACSAAADDLRSRGVSADREVVDGLTRLAGRAELGGDVADDLAVVRPGARPSWERIAVAWTTADRYGLPMVEMIGSVRADLSARRRFADRTRAGLAGPRATATVLAGLPVLGVVLGQAIGADPIGVLLGGGLGGILLVVGTTLAVAGLAWSDRIIARVTAR